MAKVSHIKKHSCMQISRPLPATSWLPGGEIRTHFVDGDDVILCGRAKRPGYSRINSGGEQLDLRQSLVGSLCIDV
jgi:hypothetical protein